MLTEDPMSRFTLPRTSLVLALATWAIAITRAHDRESSRLTPEDILFRVRKQTSITAWAERLVRAPESSGISDTTLLQPPTPISNRTFRSFRLNGLFRSLPSVPHFLFRFCTQPRLLLSDAFPRSTLSALKSPPIQLCAARGLPRPWHCHICSVYSGDALLAPTDHPGPDRTSALRYFRLHA